MALCLSIFLEAIQRFVEPQIVSNPRLVLIVGCFGLLSNVLGLFLFHEHGHSHGGDGHSHSHRAEDKLNAAEEGHGSKHSAGVDPHTAEVADEGGNIADVLPQSNVGGWPNSTRNRRSGSQDQSGEQRTTASRGFTRSDEDDSTAAGTTSPLSTRKSVSSSQQKRKLRRTSRSKSKGFVSVEDLPIHPASFRNDIIAASRLENIDSGSSTETEGEEAVEDEQEEPTERTGLLGHTRSNSSVKRKGNGAQDHKHDTTERHDSWHAAHNHNQPRDEESSGGHSHGDLNMRGVFLHVMGDALGNIGVIGSALFIWLTSYSWRFYSDPAISLVITLIILGSAIPLCKAASRILLQAVPAGMSVDKIQDDVKSLPGILSCHHFHVWQLSDTKLVASLHVRLEFDFKGEGSARYMQLARAVQTCLHEYGIHSVTIQPEFESEAIRAGAMANGASKKASRAASMRSDPDACLLECGDECGDENQCCAPASGEGSQDGHDHGHDHGHSH